MNLEERAAVARLQAEVADLSHSVSYVADRLGMSRSELQTRGQVWRLEQERRPVRKA